MPKNRPSESWQVGLGAYVVHSRYDSQELTKAAREAFRSRFERDVDPDGVLPLEERRRCAEMARKAHFMRLALKSAQVFRRRRMERGRTGDLVRHGRGRHWPCLGVGNRLIPVVRYGHLTQFGMGT